MLVNLAEPKAGFDFMFIDLNAPPRASGPDIDPATGLVDAERVPMLKATEPRQLEICRLNDCTQPILMGCEYCQRHISLIYR
jgi:hypothetical protein